MKVAGYIRVSTEDQLLSIDAQRRDIAAMAQRMGLPEPVYYVDHGISGGTPFFERPGLSALLHDKPTHVLATKRDRLARDVMQALFIEKELLKSDATLITGDAPSDSDPGSKLMRAILDAFAEYERALISYRTKKALAQAKANGKRIGGCHAPYGSKPGERDIIAYIQVHSFLKPRVIADQLNAMGHKTRKGKAFCSEDVKGIRKRHAG